MIGTTGVAVTSPNAAIAANIISAVLASIAVLYFREIYNCVGGE
jgi:hypothetical protein